MNENCLKDILKIKELCNCESDPAGQFYFHNFVTGIPPSWFSAITNEYARTGIDYGNEMIINAQGRLVSKLELLRSTGLSTKPLIDNFCNNCEFSTMRRLAGNGINIQRTNNSTNSYIKITKLRIKSNYTGLANVIIDDGINVNIVQVNLTAGNIDTYPILEYKTYMQSIRVYMQDPLIELYFVDCPSTSSCGCSGANSQVIRKNFMITGWNGTTITNEQYGIQPCIEVGCDTGNIICNLALTNKSVLAQYMAYEVAKSTIDSILMSTHLTEVKLKVNPEMLQKKHDLFNAEQDVILYGRKAGYNMAGTDGIAQIIQNYMNKGDDCIVCESTFGKAVAGF